MKSLISRRRLWAAVAVILLLLFLLRPGASRLKMRIAGSIGGALARPVEIGTVHVRLLPQPGFDLENLVVYDDPLFSAEPMLRAPEVTAVLRLTSLVRGRLEIARLNLTEPSLNLVHRENGRWNLEALLERASQTPLAPTGKSKSEARPGFPYIEASTGRVNFKIGQEKKPYALVDADFAFWQESENTWGVRLKAQPLRADLGLSDTGLLRLDGTWQRAGTLRETPLQINLEWNGAQLGQVTKFFTGNDRGWRGAMRFDATLRGTPAQLQVSSDASIEDFHRYDIPSSRPLLMAAHCDARYSSVDRTLHEIFCNGPVGGGAVALHGDMGMPGSRVYRLALGLEHVPAGAVAELASRAKKDLPLDLTATGNIEGTFSLREDGASAQGAQFDGSGEIDDLRLTSKSNKAEVTMASIPLLLASGNSSKFSLRHKRRVTDLGKLGRAGAAPGQPSFEIGPFTLGLGRPDSATARVLMNRSGYSAELTGESEVSHVQRMARLFGIPALRANAEGIARIDLELAGAWSEAGSSSGFSLPQVTGTAQLQNLRVEVRGLSGPVEISSAQVQLLPDESRVEKLSAIAAGSHWTGSLAMPRGCGNPAACAVRFTLNADEISTSDLIPWLNPNPSQRPWYRVLAAAPKMQPSFLGSLHASGRVNTRRFVIHNLAATNFSASVELDKGALQISDCRAQILGGQYQGEFAADFGAKPPAYTSRGNLIAISMGQVADAMQDGWIAGSATGSYQLKSSGLTASDFWKAAEGSAQFDLRDGMLTHISLVNVAAINLSAVSALTANAGTPLQVERFLGRARLHEGEIEFKDAKLDSPAGAFQVSGSVSLARTLDLKLAQGPLGYNITGTIAEPQVAAMTPSETRAQLKR